ncbi:hypothetical protein KA478_00075 [Patescibacteria group bacterium]|nr:hypothetical protein [Patescibacteria group bacterium]
MPKDIINSQLEQQKAKETAKNKSDIVNAKFAEALKTQFSDPKEKPTLDLIQQGSYKEALKQLRLRIDVEDKSEQDLEFNTEGYDEDGYDEKVNTASEKETYREKLVTLIAYLEEMNALETSKEQSINKLIAEIRSDLKEILGLQDGDLEEQVKAVYQKLISEK